VEVWACIFCPLVFSVQEPVDLVCLGALSNSLEYYISLVFAGKLHDKLTLSEGTS